MDSKEKGFKRDHQGNLSPTYRDLLLYAAMKLNNRREAEIILEEVLFLSSLPGQGENLPDNQPVDHKRTPGVRLFLNQHHRADPEEINLLDTMLERRLFGEPLQHILGHYSFRGLEVKTDQRALVPRPETEILVEVALDELARLRELQSTYRDFIIKETVTVNLDVLDIGTGTGVIGCSLVSECGYVNVICSDISAAALSLAKENIMFLAPEQRERIALIKTDLLQPIKSSSVDLVCANPPYLAESELAGLDIQVRDYDPKEALVAGATGFETIERIINAMPEVLKENGVLVMELAPEQAAKSLTLASTCGAKDTSIVRDLAGRDRILLARW
jgi:release factor glutamine methyltransferase